MDSPRRILVVGGGGREHALAWRLAQDPDTDIFAAPGNPGIAAVATCLPAQVLDIPALLAFALGEGIDLTVVGPEAPLLAGLADRFEAAGLAVFGPSAAAAELEGSKAFAKALFRTHAIPTAEFKAFTALDKARAHILASQTGLVVKADGLCAGKGVFVCESREEALAAAQDLLVRRTLGEAGRRIVIEERLTGDELSVFALTDGATILRLAHARDSKRLLDGDRGPNTGGMGAVSPAPGVTEELLERIDREILVPVVHAMRMEGRPYKGVLYAGLMLTPGGPKLLEVNVRFGDPEAQVLMPRIRGDLGAALLACAKGACAKGACAKGGLDRCTVGADEGSCVLAVVAASEGYPEKPRTGDAIGGLDLEETGSLVFHAGTALRDGRVVTAGGRVLSAVGLADSLEGARARAYARLERIRFPGMQARRDIGLPPARLAAVR